VDCPACGHRNRPEARFCGDCGAPLSGSLRCPGCGAENPGGQRFCDDCGRQLEPAGEGPPARRAPQPRSAIPEHLAAKIRAGAGALEGERKQVTVLFADVVGSMELSALAGPERWRSMMERLFSLCCDAVLRYEGTVDKFTGDGIMALFGAPIAHEDHAQRACFAALRLQRELEPYAAELRRSAGLSLSVRVGLNSGEVIVGAIGDELEMDYTAIGHTVGLAQRMEQLAEPGTVYMAQSTAALAEGFLELRDQGEFEVKGAGEPLRVYELTGVGAARGRLEVSRERGFSRFVGRAEEMRVLEDALEQASADRGQVIGLVGEAGVGKSRLCHEFAQRARASGMPVYHVAAQAHTKGVPLLPVLRFMRTYFEIIERDTDQKARERIAGKLLLLDEGFADDLPLIFDFLSVRDPERPPPHMDPDARQRQLLGLTKRLIRAQSAREPGITIFEDLHWLDPASEVFLTNYVEAIHGTTSLAVANFRPQYRAEWMSKSYYRQIALTPLGEEAIGELLVDLLGTDPSLAGLPERIRGRTGGNPFFIEEVVQSLVEAGSLEGERGSYRLAGGAEEVAVPASVQAVLAARIDRLTEREKAVLQTAAVIGKEFSESLLAQAAQLERSQLQDALAALVAGEFVHEQELYPEVVYAFRHPLTQEVAYESQLADRRAAVHAAIARALLDQSPERMNERAALLAQHWEAAGERLEAARWNAVAGAWTGASDPKVSARHWRKVRELTDSLPRSEESVSLGLAARIAALQYGWRLGISHEDAEAIFNEADQIAAEAGDVRSRGVLLSVYGANRGINDGDVRGYLELSTQALAFAEESGDADLFMTAALSAFAPYLAGQYRAAIAVLDRALELADGDTGAGAGIAVECPYAYCLLVKGGSLLLLGELSEAARLIEAGAKLAGERGAAEELAWGHILFCQLAEARGCPEEMTGHAQQALEIAERIGDSFSHAWAWMWVGAAERALGSWRPAVEALERAGAISRERHTGTVIEPFRLALLAEARHGLGDRAGAVNAAEDGAALNREQGNVSGELAVSLARARVLSGGDGPEGRSEAAAALADLHELIRRTGARLYEPYVHVELAELARESGEEARWRDELTEARRLFTAIGAGGHAGRVAETLAGATDAG
jgi:class 3 adenylate cyclase/tetratricopeptide (TPR) repeat protein